MLLSLGMLMLMLMLKMLRNSLRLRLGRLSLLVQVMLLKGLWALWSLWGAGAAGSEESPVEVAPAEEPEAAQVETEATRVMAIRPAARTAAGVEVPGAEEEAGGGPAESSQFVLKGGPGRKCF